VDLSSVTGIIKDVGSVIGGDNRGFFYSNDPYKRAISVAREYGRGTKYDEYELMRLMGSEGYGGNYDKVKEGTRLFDEKGNVLREVVEAYKDEIALEEKKIGIAGREAAAIKKLGITWKDYVKHISDAKDISEEVEKLKNGTFFV